MANLNVTYENLDAAAARLRSGQNNIETTLGDLQRLVTELVSNGFTTVSASGAFDGAYLEFTAGAQRTVAGIEGMAQFLGSASEALRSTDEQLARSIHRT